MPNLIQKIVQHNRTVLKKSEPLVPVRGCNCRNRANCPLQNKCLTENLIYQATVTPVEINPSSNTISANTTANNSKNENYVGLSSTTFKLRYANHTQSFRDPSYKSKTTLSQYIWKLQDDEKNYNINWNILSIAKPYSADSKTCNLCSKEKLFIITKPHMSTLNKRNDLTSICRHRRNFLLSNHPT